MRGVSPILDPYGRKQPASYRPGYSDFFKGGDVNATREQPDAYYRGYFDTQELVTNASWRQILSAGRYIRANVPVIAGCFLEQQAYTFPLDARYAGADKEFGRRAEVLLDQWDENPTLRGWPFDAHFVSRVRMAETKTDGDIYTILTEDENGFPRIQLQRAHRVGNTNTWYRSSANDWNNNVPLKDGPYKGKKICNGVVIDDYARPIAYKIPGVTVEADQYVPASSMIPMRWPTYADEHRGISHLCVAIPSVAVWNMAREFEQRAMLIQSSIAVSEKNETGGPDPLTKAIESGDYGTATDGGQATMTTQTLEKGLYKYFKAGTGSGLEFHIPDRPGDNWQSYEDRLCASFLYGIGWDPNFALMIKEPGGANARVVLQKINRCLILNAGVEARIKRIERAYACQKFIDLGLLTPPKDGDVTSWKFRMGLPQLTADSGNEENAKREAYKLGFANLLTITTEKGLDWEELREQREVELNDKWARVARMQTKFASMQLTPTQWAEEFEQRNPNGSQVAGQASSQTSSDPAATAS